MESIKGGFNWDNWFQSEMRTWTPADTKLFMKQEEDHINSFHDQTDKCHENRKKENEEINQQ